MAFNNRFYYLRFVRVLLSRSTSYILDVYIMILMHYTYKTIVKLCVIHVLCLGVIVGIESDVSYVFRDFVFRALPLLIIFVSVGVSVCR